MCNCLIDKCLCTIGFARVEGDEDEDGIDDLENEFDYVKSEPLGFTQTGGAVGSNYGGLAGSATASKHDSSQGVDIPLLTYGEEVMNNLNSVSLTLSLSPYIVLCESFFCITLALMSSGYVLGC